MDDLSYVYKQTVIPAVELVGRMRTYDIISGAMVLGWLFGAAVLVIVSLHMIYRFKKPEAPENYKLFTVILIFLLIAVSFHMSKTNPRPFYMGGEISWHVLFLTLVLFSIYLMVSGCIWLCVSVIPQISDNEQKMKRRKIFIIFLSLILAMTSYFVFSRDCGLFDHLCMSKGWFHC